MGAGDSRIALVSGANRGIGLAIAASLARSGMTVFLGSRDRKAGERAAATIDADMHATELDITDAGSVDRCIVESGAAAGRLDVLVNNAGVVLDARSRAVALEVALVRDTLEINLFGTWRLSIAALDLLRRGSAARIINLSSGMGQLPEMGEGSPGYRVSKTAVNALTRMLAAELSSDGVSVNAVCPGWVHTDMGGPQAPRDVDTGADTVVWLATLPPDQLPSGAFLRDRR